MATLAGGRDRRAAAYAGRLALVQRDLIAGVFDDGDSATVVDTPDPFGDKERVNVLLLGGDGGEGREGVRTDTVIVASISTDTGETTLFSLPRNLEDLPFPEDSPLADVYPDGFWAGSEDESLLNAVYRNGPAAHPDILGPTDDPGADFLKLGVGEALGLTSTTTCWSTSTGSARLVDALGGITVNVNYWVPVGGEPTLGVLPDDYIRPGPQPRDGRPAWRWRSPAADSASPTTTAWRGSAARSTRSSTPPTRSRCSPSTRSWRPRRRTSSAPTSRSRALDDFVDLAFLVKDAPVRSVVFDTSLIDPAYPDYDEIRQIVDDALGAPTPPSRGARTPPRRRRRRPPAPRPSGAAEPTQDRGDPLTDVGDACAYDEEQAQQALEDGEPPTRGR